LVGRFLKGRVGIGLIIGIVAIIITAIALFLPWYGVTASSETGPLAQEGGVNLMTLDGVNGIAVNLFLGSGSSDSTSGYVNLFSTAMPFAIILAASVLLLTLDVIGIKDGKNLGKKLIIGIVSTLLPVILIIVFVSQLSALTPLAAGLLPGQGVPSQVESMVRAISASPMGGSATSQFPVVGSTTVNWGLGIGAYLFIVAAVLRIIGGIIMYSAPTMQTQDWQKAPPLPPPPPPPPQYATTMSPYR
jgi:hypothetical protein